LAFLAVVGTGLVLRTAGFAGVGHVPAEEEIARSFAVSGTPKLVVDAFNGPIQIDRGGSGKIDCTVVRRASGADQAEAKANLKNVSVAMSEDAGTVHVTVRRAGLAWDAGASVRVHVPEGTTISLRNENGPINVRGIEGPVDARATNGTIRIEDATGAVTLHTTNGRIACDAADAVVSAGATNGPIEFHGTLAAGQSAFETINGRVTLKLPEGLAFHLDARTSNGKVATDFDVDGERDRKGKRLVGRVGHDPKVNLKVRTTNGNIRISEDD
jgi:DUF4097 and DUF4098 domain-containing protein YvlB